MSMRIVSGLVRNVGCMRRILSALIICCSLDLVAFAYFGPVDDRVAAASLNADGIPGGNPSVVPGFEQAAFAWEGYFGIAVASEVWFDPTTQLYTYFYRIQPLVSQTGGGGNLWFLGNVSGININHGTNAGWIPSEFDPPAAAQILGLGTDPGAFTFLYSADAGQSFTVFIQSPLRPGIIHGYSEKVTPPYTLPAGGTVFGPPFNILIDVMPDSCSNVLDIKTHGLVPVAIFGSQDFDVTTIDPGSLRLYSIYPGTQPVVPVRSDLRDVTIPGCGSSDAFWDLVLYFKSNDLIKAFNAVAPLGNSYFWEMQLAGNLTNGTPILGEDAVVTATATKK